MGFGDHSITKQTYELIQSILPAGKTILELGSGYGTMELSKHYTMYSIEHDRGWINKHQSTYIHAPLVNNWYDVDIIKSNIPDHYDLLLVDGPPTHQRRRHFIEFMNLFDTSAIWVFDDLQRAGDMETYKMVCESRNKSTDIHDCGQKLVGIILDN